MINGNELGITELLLVEGHNLQISPQEEFLYPLPEIELRDQIIAA